MKQKIKLKDFYNEYSNNYLKLSNLIKYNCYHDLFYKLNDFFTQQITFKNILFVHQQPNDIDYLTLLSNKYDNANFFMTGVHFNKFSREFYYSPISDIYKDYEFVSFSYQPKFDKLNWKELKEKCNQIDLIILPSKIADISKKTIYLSDKKLIKFLKKFTNAKIFGIGFDFSLTNKNTRKINKYGIKFEEYISIKINEPIWEERENK